MANKKEKVGFAASKVKAIASWWPGAPDDRTTKEEAMRRGFGKSVIVRNAWFAPPRSAWVAALLVVWGLASSSEALATPITYYLSSTIESGSLGSTTLSNTPVEFTVVSDTSGVSQVIIPGNSGLFYQN